MKFFQNAQKYPVILLCIVMLVTFIVTKPQLASSKSLYFGEFVQSTNFRQLLQDTQHSLSYRLYGGTYNLGFPYSTTKETVFGTQRGVRALPLVTLSTLLQTFFGNYWDKLYFTLIFLAPFIGFYLAARIFIPPSQRQFLWIGTVFFGANPWIMSRISTGFWQLNLAYACLPYIFLCITHVFSKSYSSSRERFIHTAILALCSSIVYAFQPHFLLMLSIPLTFALFITGAHASRSALKNGCVNLLIFTCLCILLNGYHLVSLIIYKPFHISLPGQDLTLSAVLFNGQGSRIIDVLKLTPISPLQFATYSFTKLDYLSYGFFVFAVIFTCIFLARKNITKAQLGRVIETWGFILMFVFIAKGITEPFSELSTHVYSSSFFSFFRDPSRFYSMIALGLSLLFVQFDIQNKKVARALMILLILWLLPTIIFLSNQTALHFAFQAIPTPNLANPTSKGRLLYYPQNIPMSGFKWHDGETTGVNNNPLFALHPIENRLANYSGFVDSYFNQLSAYTSQAITTGSPSAHLLNKLNVDTIIQDNDIHPLYAYSTTIDAESLISNNFKPTTISEKHTRYTTDIKQNVLRDGEPLFVIGDLRTFDNIARRTSKPLILLNQPHNIKEFQRLRLTGSTIVFESDDNVDQLFLDDLTNYSLHPEKTVWDNKTQWSLHEAGIQSDVIRGLLHTSSRSIEPKTDTSKLIVPIQASPDFYILATRYTLPIADSGIEIQLGTHTDYIRANENTHFQWHISKPIRLEPNTPLTIRAKNSRSIVIDDILLIPQKEFDQRKAILSRTLENNRLIKVESIKNLPSKVSAEPVYSQSSHDTWNISSRSPWITFNMPFDHGWNITNQKGVFVGDYYGLTFYSDSTLQKKITYAPERPFVMFRNVSIITALVLVTFIATEVKRGTNKR